jgi:hypothetical protein
MVTIKLIVTGRKEVEISTSYGLELRYRFSKGFWYITEIIKHPDTEIPTVMLRAEKNSLIDLEEYYEFFDVQSPCRTNNEGFSIAMGDAGIELSDRKTVDDCFKRLNRVNEKIALLRNGACDDPALLQGLEREREFILQYLKCVYNPYMKRMRMSSDEARRICHAVDVAVKRSIKLIEKDDRFIAATLRARITINRYAVYRSESDLNIEIFVVKSGDRDMRNS